MDSLAEVEGEVRAPFVKFEHVCHRVEKVAFSVLHVVLDVAQVVVPLHLLSDLVGVRLRHPLSVVEVQLLNVVLLLSLSFRLLAFEGLVRLLDPSLLLLFLLLTRLQFLLLLLTHLLKILLF
mgnify:CR=1 FL=1